MPITRVQATPKVTTVSATPSASVTFATPPTVGNSIVVASVNGLVTGAVTSVTDNHGNAYTLVKAQSEPSIPSTVALYICPAVTTTGAPFTVTVNGSSAYRIVIALEVSPLVLDQAVGTNGVFPTAPTTGTTPALTGAEVFVVAVVGTTSGVITVDASTPTWLQEAEEVTSTFLKGEIDSRGVPSAPGTTQSASWTLSGANYWTAVLAAFKSGALPAVERVDSFIWGPC